MKRQGELLFKRVKRIPVMAVQKDNIIAKGESTGHMHQFLDPAVQCYVTAAAVQYVLVPPQGAVLTHEEHDPLEFEAGAYQVIRQREFSLLDEIQQVRD